MPKQSKTSSKIEIREMTIDDLPEVFALGEKIFTAEKWPNIYRAWDEYEVAELFVSDGDFCIIAETNEKIIGFALGTLIEKGTAWNYGYLLWLAVSPRYTKSGIGSKLLERITNEFIQQGARMLIVETAEENIPAVKFFRKQGFENEVSHVYFSKNLSQHPSYIKKNRIHRGIRKLKKSRKKTAPRKVR